MSANEAAVHRRGGRCRAAPDGAEAGLWRHGRTIGPWGSAARAVAGLVALALGLLVPYQHPLFDLPGSSSVVVGLLVGLVGVPVTSTGALWARGRAAPPVHLGHRAACVVMALTVAAAQLYPIAVWVSIGAPLLLLAAIGRGGCELLAVPNLVLRRDDYLFCLPFTPVDAWERRRATHRRRARIRD